MRALNFDNRWVRELPGDTSGAVHSRHTHEVCWAATTPTPVSQPRLLAWSPEAAALLDLDAGDVQSDVFREAFSGNTLLPGMTPYATRYGGHQFGQWAGQLGDGRAISLGEAINSHGERWELQLKGAGQTAYSRRADGRAVLRSSLREFLCSEAMHHLGIPTTRALSLMASGESVWRDMLYDGNPRHEPGAIVCRMAPSFTRFGHFQIHAAQGELALLRRLVDFTLARDFAHLTGPADEKFAAWFVEVCERTARLITAWMRVGFVHGVMNTDNMSILGLTIDYGPYGWIDNFDPGWTPNTTDAETHRYCFGNQIAVARWNLERLAEALSPVAPSAAALDAGLAAFDMESARSMQTMLAAKFGWRQWQDDDATLAGEILDLLQRSELDMTAFFRALATLDLAAPEVEILHGSAYREALFGNHRAALAAWLQRYAQRTLQENPAAEERRALMNRSNPRFVLRNYLAQQAIEAAERDHFGLLRQLLDAARHPYDENHAPELLAKRPDWARHKPGASMLSCSS